MKHSQTETTWDKSKYSQQRVQIGASFHLRMILSNKLSTYILLWDRSQLIRLWEIGLSPKRKGKGTRRLCKMNLLLLELEIDSFRHSEVRHCSWDKLKTTKLLKIDKLKSLESKRSLTQVCPRNHYKIMNLGHQESTRWSGIKRLSTHTGYQ